MPPVRVMPCTQALPVYRATYMRSGLGSLVNVADAVYATAATPLRIASEKSEVLNVLPICVGAAHVPLVALKMLA